jgi:hypothetical protein
MTDFNTFTQIWEQWPDLNVSQKLIVLLFVKYQVNESFGRGNFECYIESIVRSWIF